MIKLSLLEIKNKYIELINHHISREEADRWAYFFIQKYEYNELSFFPPEYEKNIWEGLMFLYGVDLQESPGLYLHSIENIKDKYNEIFNEKKLI